MGFIRVTEALLENEQPQVHLSDDDCDEAELDRAEFRKNDEGDDMVEDQAMQYPIATIELSDAEDLDRNGFPIPSLRPLFSITKTSLSRVEDPQGKLDDAAICGALEVLQQVVGRDRLRYVDSLHLDASDHIMTDFASARILIPIHLPKRDHWALAFIKEFREEIDVYDSYPLLDDQRSVQEKILKWYKISFGDHNNTDVTVTAPRCRCQTDNFDCGLNILIFSFHLAVGKSPPSRADSIHWRRLLSQLLQPLSEQENEIVHSKDKSIKSVPVECVPFIMPIPQFPTSTEVSSRGSATIAQIQVMATEYYNFMKNLPSIVGATTRPTANKRIHARIIDTLALMRNLMSFAGEDPQCLAVREAVVRISRAIAYLQQAAEIIKAEPWKSQG
ncbi:hypothetical protein BKA67DRAFT_660087 [Truncatella angustata]|uniref:Ubiquitin-like protease family profile domain-containing protein n=1 Tax=Truncatella angustata TaxID=152316 RepID=A0A9P8ZX05_9PEZI|nr:uncharacterized protein BKA67DRAFT_660087 [Truncatella angustata]KAH6653477.1 hypothetical protein BKA67DRAFT_660087 [Truncatella angustata]